MKISLFYKTISIGAVFVLATIFVLGLPTQVSANCQTVPLLETTATPATNMKILGDSILAPIVEDQALQAVDGSLGLDSDINPYISTSTKKIGTYTVQKGDTISKVAKKFGISENTIIFANADIKNSALKVGQTLVILPVDGAPYVVQKGDTLSLIAKKYKASVEDIADFNNIDKTKGLKVGDSIIVPGGTAPKKPEVIAVIPKSEPTPEKVEEKTIPEVIPQPQVVPAPTPAVTPTPEEITTDTQSTKNISKGYIWPFPAGTGLITQGPHADRAVDIGRVPKGTPIYAIADGTVLIADAVGYNGGYGEFVVINFDSGAQGIFAHMSRVLTKNGAVVKQGDIIGLVGSTGHSTGPHLHVGWHDNGNPNPFEKVPKNSNNYVPND